MSRSESMKDFENWDEEEELLVGRGFTKFDPTPILLSYIDSDEEIRYDEDGQVFVDPYWHVLTYRPRRCLEDSVVHWHVVTTWTSFFTSLFTRLFAALSWSPSNSIRQAASESKRNPCTCVSSSCLDHFFSAFVDDFQTILLSEVMREYLPHWHHRCMISVR